MLTHIGQHHPDVWITGMSKKRLIPGALKQPLDAKAEQDKKGNTEVWHQHIAKHSSSCTSLLLLYFVKY